MGKLTIQKVNLGSSQEASGIIDAIGSGLNMAQTGASIAGPLGAGIGAAAGFIPGLITSINEEAMRKLKINEQKRQQTVYDTNKQFEQEDTKQIGNLILAEDGLDISSSKIIEVEGGELVFEKKVLSNGKTKFKLKADLKNAPKHEQGGLLYPAKEGDVIIPSNKSKEALEAYKSKDDLKLESMRLKLPEDTVPLKRKGTKGIKMYPNGTSSIESLPGEKGFIDMSLPSLLDLKKEGNKINNSLNNQLSDISNLEYQKNAILNRNLSPFSRFSFFDLPIEQQEIEKQNFNSQYFKNPTQAELNYKSFIEDLPELKKLSKYKSGTSGIVEPLSSIQRAIPSFSSQNFLDFESSGIPNLNIPNNTTSSNRNEELTNTELFGGLQILGNLAQNIGGLTESAEIEQPFNLKANLLKYTDASEPLRQQARQTKRLSIDRARQASGGSAANFLSNAAQADSVTFSRIQDINNNEIQRRDRIDNANTQIQNQVDAFNQRMNDELQQRNMQNRASLKFQRRQNLQNLLGSVAGFGRDLGLQQANKNQNQAMANRDQSILQSLDIINPFAGEFLKRFQ